MAQHNLWSGLSRGFMGHCPNCGQGALLHSYLKVTPTCAACGHDNGRYPADDAPPYFTILIVGHLVVPPLVLFPGLWTLSPFLLLGVALPLVALLTLVLLPRIKGAVIGVQWAITKTEGKVPGQNDEGAWVEPNP
ncbi:MAG: DUF983 domain-containing protein [Caulobacteraceae bacterium]|nr:DUF983 domain-containing protein [Caulobacteraceae bacterium]